MGRKISQVGISLIKSFEGCQLKAYKPVPTEKYWTIGWGHYGPDVKEGSTITRAKADSMLVTDLEKYEAYVNNPAYVPVTAKLNQNQFDALTSFCYNCGNGSLKQLCKGRTIAEIAQNITKYNKGGGNVLAGLVRRRQAELDLYNKAVVPAPTPVPVPDSKENVLDTDVANIIIKMWLSPAWHAATSEADRGKIHELAEDVRRAARILPVKAGWKLTPTVANYVISTWLSPAWWAAAGSDDKQLRIKGYANALRKSSGQPEQ